MVCPIAILLGNLENLYAFLAFFPTRYSYFGFFDIKACATLFATSSAAIVLMLSTFIFSSDFRKNL